MKVGYGWLLDLDPTKKKYKNRPTGSVALELN